jgi:small-conductance mechanosensitive channel
LVNQNPDLVVNFNKDPNYWYWDDIIYDVLQQIVFWMVGYLLIRILVLYISVHYHYRSDQVQITHSKEMHQALVALYEASIYLHPVNSRHFVLEDSIIRNSSGSGTESASRQNASELLRKVGMDGHSVAHFFGNFKSQQHSHWLHPGAPYAVVERALSHPKPAAALAKRIWMSLVVQGKESFSADDIAEVLGPYRRDEALDIFKIIDENESGDIRLDEMVWTVVEAGRIRHSIYQTMADINHCINTFDWIALLLLAGLMIFFILLLYVPTIKDIQNTAGYLAIGLAFAVGRTVNKYLVGCIFVFFEHPFDIGDRVNIFNMAANISVSAIATRQSLLYTVFRRVDNGTDIQITNERLAMKRIENISRSGVNKQALTISVDFKTTFKDIMFLRSELEAFLKVNHRDYQPTLGLSVVNLHDLEKLELSVSFTHKSNWSNERLRASRSSKFMCALVAATRKIPLYKPNASRPLLGEDGRPLYTVAITNAEAAAQVAADKKKREEVRIDAAEKQQQAALADEAARRKAEKARAEAEAEEVARKGLTKVPVVDKPVTHDGEEDEVVQTLLQHSGSGLRTSVSGPAGMFYQVG